MSNLEEKMVRFVECLAVMVERHGVSATIDRLKEVVHEVFDH